MDILETGYLVTPWAVAPKKGKPLQYLLVPVVFLDDTRWRVSGSDVQVRDWDEIAFATKRAGPMTPGDCCFIITGTIRKATAKKLPETYLAAASIMSRINSFRATGAAVFLQTKEHDYLWGQRGYFHTPPVIQPRGTIMDIRTKVGKPPMAVLLTLIGNVYEA